MKENTMQIKETIQSLDNIKKTDENGKDYWEAHNLSKALGYTDYRNFKQAINRAKQQMEQNNIDPDEHLVGTNESFISGNGAEREVEGYKLDRRAAYTVAMNADPSKHQVAVAQEYFLQKTATAEKIEKRLNQKERINNRIEHTEKHNKLITTVMQRDVPPDKVGIVVDSGNKGFFDMSTKELKEKNHIPPNKPVADYMNSDALVFKSYANVKARTDIEKHDIKGVKDISEAVYNRNREMRESFKESFNQNPEDTVPEKDIKKIEREFRKKGQEYIDALDAEA